MTELVVDPLEVIEVDLEEAVAHPGATDVGPYGAQVLVQPTSVAGAGQRVDPGGQLEGVVDALQLDHVGIRSASEGPDALELGEAADLRSLEEVVAGQARADRDDDHDEEVVALGGGEAPDRIEHQVHGDEHRVAEQPAQVHRGAPRQDEGDEAGQQEQVGDGLDGQRRHGQAGDDGGQDDARGDDPGDRFRVLAERAGQRGPSRPARR